MAVVAVGADHDPVIITRGTEISINRSVPVVILTAIDPPGTRLHDDVPHVMSAEWKDHYRE
jgi:hypothetical protein